MSQNDTQAITPIIDNIILDDSVAHNVDDIENSSIVLFSTLKSDAKPLKPFKLNTSGIDYPQMYAPKCAICNSPHRTLLEHVYLDCGKKVNTTIKFFEDHYSAKLNWAQVKQHVKYHCDFNKIETPGLLDYEGREEELSRWKYREFELVLTALMVELNDVRGINAKTADEILKRSAMIEKLTRQLMLVKEKRDDSSGLMPNVFEVLLELHDQMVNDEDKRLIREKGRDLRQMLDRA
jgi:hypothetical protein